MVGTPFGFAGQFSDEATGLQYLRARYYDPKGSQQFTSRDPMGGGQPYAYAAGNPVNGTDPTGGIAWVPILLAVGLFAGGVAVDVGFDYAADPAGFDLGASLGSSLSNPLTYAGLLPFGKLGQAGRWLGRVGRLGRHIDDLPNPGSGITLIGKTKDLAAFRHQSFNILDDVMEQTGQTYSWGLNKRWLDEAIKRKDTVRLVSPVTSGNVFYALGSRSFWRWGPLTGYGREIAYLYLRGYKRAGGEMVRRTWWPVPR